jgi:hypothetical protein
MQALSALPGADRDGQISNSVTSVRPTGRALSPAARLRLRRKRLISVGPSPLLSKKERSPADSRITQRRSSRPSTALLPWSPSTGTGGRHPPETVVPSNRKPRSPWPGARSRNVPGQKSSLQRLDSANRNWRRRVCSTADEGCRGGIAIWRRLDVGSGQQTA